MNQMPISECYLSKFNIQPHYHRLIVYIHKVRWVFQLRRVFQTQVPISLVILVIGIQDLYTSKYKYTITLVILVIGIQDLYTSKYKYTINSDSGIIYTIYM